MLTIRPADVDDAPAIAKVHVDTWRTTYGGIIPQHYLDSLTVQNRSVGWVRLLERTTTGLMTLVSEDHDGRIVGFISAGPLRHRDTRFQAEISSLIGDAFKRLDTEQRTLLWLREVEGQSYAELAKILEIPVGTVRSRLFAAREALRTIWLSERNQGKGGWHDMQ